ncbi:MAG: glutaminyl-peptide cyclotransferase [Alistipes sp.]|nr:glutaminyl-peptide cyclotransferase [Candidatus Alistipes equi]
MFKYLTIVIAVATLLCCGTSGGKKESMTTPVKEPVRYTFRVINTYPHSTQSYTQGLEYVEGTMWEGTGLNGMSYLQTISLLNGKVTHVNKLPNSEFGEGITLLDGKIYQLTWQSHTAHIYDLKTKKHIQKARYKGEGWGLANDGERIYLSDGTSTIRIIERDTFKQSGSIEVTLRGQRVELLNELEWIEGKIWANIYTTHFIIIINPKNGEVEGIANLEGILPPEQTDENTDVLNGIAYDNEQKRIFVTGKNWPKIFEIELIEI